MNTRFLAAASRIAASTPKARIAKRAKPQCLQPFLPTSLGQCSPSHCPAQPGAFLREPGAILSHAASAAGNKAAGDRGVEDKVVCDRAEALGQPLDIAKVAKLIGCSPWTVRQTLIPRGLPYFRFKASGRLIFYEAQVIRWIENQQQGGKTTK